MNKDVKYNGYSVQPSDYECPDGELALALNVIPQDGALQPIHSPKELLTIYPGHEILIIHSVPGQENFIILTGSRNALFNLSWLERTDSLTSTENATPIPISPSLSNFCSIAIVGNTLAVATASGVYYILWKDDGYKFLGNKPPFLPISFGAYRAGTLDSGKAATYSDVPPKSFQSLTGDNSGAHSPRFETTPADDAFWEQLSNQALGLMLSEISENIIAIGHVYQPFYLRYAYRLYDGSYSWHSAPILMLVSTHQPIIKLRDCNVIDDSSLRIVFSLQIPYYSIAYRIFGSLNKLKDWSDIISGIDVFMTEPIYTYDQSKPVKSLTQEKSIYTRIFSRLPGNFSGRNSNFPNFDPQDNQTSTLSSKIYLGHWGSALNGNYADHFITDLSDYTQTVCLLESSEKFNDKIQHQSIFYKVSALDLHELQQSQDMKDLPLIKADLSNLTTLETLSDDYNSHATIISKALHSYNNRLLMGDISIKPPKPFSMFSMAQATSKTDDDLPAGSLSGSEKIMVFTRINGQKCVSQYLQPVPQTVDDVVSFPYNSGFPRFIYHPDPAAYKMEITTADGNFYSLPLSPHPYLNGTYWFGGIGGEPENISDDVDDSSDTVAIVGNKLYLSEINNPFIFPVQNIITLDCGRIFNLSSASKALSQGQFGQFPLYAFTDNGIWAMEISNTGTISARQPITRDVCLNPDSITQIDSAVLFATDRGIMIISGSQTQSISDPINSDTPFDVLSLPQMNKLHSMLGHEVDSCLPIAPFSTFLKTCRMIYDYVHQRIIIYSPEFSYAYLFSLKSKQWGMMYSTIEAGINSYPEALATDLEGRLVDFSQTDVNTLNSLVVTRPLKLDAANIHKTIDCIIQRGNFAKGHVQSVLYGSRDLINWHLVWSGKDHFLRGFRGTPYKYFRVALLCNLSPGESIYGASVQFTPRLTNQSR